MKKTVVGIFLVILIWQFLIIFLMLDPFSEFRGDPVVASLPEYGNSERYYSDGFQDFTNYCKYYFSKNDVKK